MTSPAAIPATAPGASPGLTPDGLWHSSFRSMASPVRVQLGWESPRPAALHAAVRRLFEDVARECTRFEPDSDLMRANAAGEDWQVVGRYCFAALLAAMDAHVMTRAMFDPRVLRTLTGLGYDRTLPFDEGVALLLDDAPDDDTADADAPDDDAPAARGPWTPGFDPARSAVRVGPEPVDLGGIGKGLALRWAAEHLRAAGTDTFLIDAGGDCVAQGGGPDGEGWRIGVEDPLGGSSPLAVLELADAACATSSTRLLSWTVGERAVHHLIDPRTGRPGGDGLRAVTVVADDPAEAEVWSKTLFLHGADIAQAAGDADADALWVYADGRLDATASARRHIIWERP